MTASQIWNRIRATKWQGWTMLFVVALGAFLRFYGLGAESLWTDELSTLQLIQGSVADAISVTIVKGTPPIYYLIQILLRGILPSTEFGLRFLSAIADTCSILLLYLLGRRLVGGPAAVLAAAFYAISIRAIWFAQEARAYSMSILVILLVALSLLRLIERPTWGRAVAHGIAVIVLLYTHVYAMFPLIALELTILVLPRLRRRAGKKWLLSLAAAALVYLPWAFILFEQAMDRTEVAARGTWTLSAPEGFVTPILSSIAEFSPGIMDFIPYYGTSSWSLWIFPGLVIFGVVGRAAFRRTDILPSTPAPEESVPDNELPPIDVYTSFERRLLLGGWLAAIFAGGNLVSHYILPIFSFRMASQAMPALYLAASNGVRQIWKPAAFALMIGLALLSFRGLAPYYADDGTGNIAEKEQWRDVLVHLDEHANEYDGILVIPNWHIDQMEEYAAFLGIDLPEMVGLSRGLEGDELALAMQPVLASGDRVLVISSHIQRDSEGLSPPERTLTDDSIWGLDEHTGLRGIHLRSYVRQPWPQD